MKSNRNGAINFSDLEISARDAALGPLIASMKSPDPSATIWQSMNHDVTSGREVRNRGAIDVALLRIRNVQRQMVIAIRFVEIARVNPFRRSLIAFILLCPNGRAA